MISPLFVITTSETKFFHIFYLCSLNNVELIRLPYKYPEIQDNDMATLLKFSLENAYFPEKNKVFFIIEQTSVFLKSFHKEGPGFFFKDWWENTNKTELKSLISKDPRAIIESGVALSIPGHPPLIFTNKQRGKVSLGGYILPENEKYPWLSSDDFNLYFIPSGATRVYNAMPLNETLKYDFRKPNIDEVCRRIHEYSSILSENVALQEIISVAESFRVHANTSRQKRLDSKEWIK